MRLLRRFIAADWLLKFYFGAAGAFSLGLVVAETDPDLALLSHWIELLQFLALALSGVLAGLLFSTIFVHLFVAPIHEIFTRLNGGPFMPGDDVEVLCGAFTGRRGQVYSSWQGNSVRVELGEQSRESFRDVFSQHQLLRVGKNRDVQCA